MTCFLSLLPNYIVLLVSHSILFIARVFHDSAKVTHEKSMNKLSRPHANKSKTSGQANYVGFERQALEEGKRR